MKIQKIKSGTKVFDWVIPKEWEVKQAYISDLNGKKSRFEKRNCVSQ